MISSHAYLLYAIDDTDRVQQIHMLIRTCFIPSEAFWFGEFREFCLKSFVLMLVYNARLVLCVWVIENVVRNMTKRTFE